MPQDRKPKQTKQKRINNIVHHVDKTLRDNFIKNLVQGGEIMAQEVLDMINEGKSVEDIKFFCESLLKVDDKTWIGERDK